MRGRASRSEFWWFSVVNILIGILAVVADVAMGGGGQQPGPVETATLILFFLPQFTVTVRRLHDTGRSVWYVLTPLPLCALGIALGAAFGPRFGQPAATAAGAVTLLAFIIPFLWLLQRSDPRANRYGPISRGAAA